MLSFSTAEAQEAGEEVQLPVNVSVNKPYRKVVPSDQEEGHDHDKQQEEAEMGDVDMTESERDEEEQYYPPPYDSRYSSRRGVRSETALERRHQKTRRKMKDRLRDSGSGSRDRERPAQPVQFGKIKIRTRGKRNRKHWETTDSHNGQENGQDHVQETSAEQTPQGALSTKDTPKPEDPRKIVITPVTSPALRSSIELWKRFRSTATSAAASPAPAQKHVVEKPILLSLPPYTAIVNPTVPFARTPSPLPPQKIPTIADSRESPERSIRSIYQRAQRPTTLAIRSFPGPSTRFINNHTSPAHQSQREQIEQVEQNRHLDLSQQSKRLPDSIANTPQRPISALNPESAIFHASRQEQSSGSISQTEVEWREAVEIAPDECDACGGSFVCAADGVSWHCETCKAKRHVMSAQEAGSRQQTQLRNRSGTRPVNPHGNQNGDQRQRQHKSLWTAQPRNQYQSPGQWTPGHTPAMQPDITPPHMTPSWSFSPNFRGPGLSTP